MTGFRSDSLSTHLVWQAGIARLKRWGLLEHFAVQELLFDGDRVTGVRGRTQSGGLVNEQARIVIGADGRNSNNISAMAGAWPRCRPTMD